LTDVAVLLPPGAKDAYFIDQIGNVSTSHFRSAPADSELIDVPSHEIPDHKASLLHLQPRYPILGGWNYTYTVGWNLPLSDGWLTILPNSFPQEYSVAIPFWNAMRNVPAGIVRTEIVLPEGAEIVSVETPFETEEIRYTTYTTYLDTIGRPAVVITKERATEREGANVYVTYRMDTTAHLMKPMAVASVFFAMFAGALVLRRLQSRK
jgi:oligosaccharyltransferase complex subunit alpha (ribophorin I)